MYTGYVHVHWICTCTQDMYMYTGYVHVHRICTCTLDMYVYVFTPRNAKYLCVVQLYFQSSTLHFVCSCQQHMQPFMYSHVLSIPLYTCACTCMCACMSPSLQVCNSSLRAIFTLMLVKLKLRPDTNACAKLVSLCYIMVKFSHCRLIC